MSYWELSGEKIVVTVQEFSRRLKATRQIVYIWIARGMPVLRSSDGKMLIPYEEALEWAKEKSKRGDSLQEECKRTMGKKSVKVK